MGKESKLLKMPLKCTKLKTLWLLYRFQTEGVETKNQRHFTHLEEENFQKPLQIARRKRTYSKNANEELWKLPITASILSCFCSIISSDASRNSTTPFFFYSNTWQIIDLGWMIYFDRYRLFYIHLNWRNSVVADLRESQTVKSSFWWQKDENKQNRLFYPHR